MKQKSIVLCLFAVSAIFIGCKQDSTSTSATTTAAEHEASATPANLPAAIAKAKAENKLLLLEFAGSDWCPPCMLFQEKVFSQKEFLDYEKTNLIFVRFDYPKRSKLPADVEATNVLVGKTFEIYAFPTFVALDGDGKEFWRSPAKDDPHPGIPGRLFNPQGFIEWIESVKAQKK